MTIINLSMKMLNNSTKFLRQSVIICNIYFKSRQIHNLRTTESNLKPMQFLVVKRFAQNKPIKCWKCGIERHNITELFCEQCRIIQNPRNRDNYFKIFELTEDFNIDSKLLTQKYRNLQSMLHPDKFSNKSNEEKIISEEYSSLINEAYNILSIPLKRAIHLLHLKGGSLEEGEKIENPQFLMEIMELNEEVENATTEEQLRKLHKKNQIEVNNIAKDISENFQNDDIEKAKQNIIKMKYFNSIQVHINSLMREKGIVD